MRKILFILVLVLGIGGVSVAQTAQTQPSKEYVAALKKMIVVSGNDATFKLVIPQMFAMMKQQLPNVPAEFWSEAEKEMMKTLVDDLVEMLAPIYHKRLTLSDLQEITKFYESPVGKKMAAAQPAIATESMAVGQQWGMKIATKVQESLKAKGYL